MDLSRRRTLLGAGGVVLTTALVGCVAAPTRTSGEDCEPEEHVDDWHDDPKPATGDPITIEHEEPEEAGETYARDTLEQELETEFPDAELLVASRETIRIDRVAKPLADRSTPSISADTLQQAAPSSITVVDPATENEVMFEVEIWNVCVTPD